MIIDSEVPTVAIGDRPRRTVQEWEQHLGAQVRRGRLDQNLSQARLAHLADVSVSTIHNLEAGEGSSLSTLVKVARALGRDEWLGAFAPPVPVSPMQMLRERQQQASTMRRRASPQRETAP